MKLKKVLMMLSGMAVASSMFVSCGNSASDSGSKDETSKKDLASSDVTVYEGTNPDGLPAAAKERKDTLVVGQSAPEGKLNPLFMESAYDFSIVGTMYDSLFNVTADADLEPNLLKDYSVSDDGLTYTFNLKDGLKWSDGSKMTTKDIEMYYLIACDASYNGASDFVTGSANIKGAAEYQAGTADSISGIEVVDDKTIKITLTEVSSSALYQLNVAPVCAEYYGKYYKQGDVSELKQHISTSPEVPVSGGYKLVSFEKGGDVVLEANENHAAGKAKIKNLIFRVTSEDTAEAMLESGEIDIDADDISANDDNIEALEAAGFLSYQYYPTNGYGYVGINHKNPVLADKAVRKALATALDRERITNSVFGNYGQVINVPQSKVSWAYSAGSNTYDYDIEAAKKILDDAGWKAGADGIREKDGVKLAFKLSCATQSAITNPLVSVADSSWKELGVDFTSEIIDFNTLLEKQKAGQFDAFFMAWGLTADPNDSNIYNSQGSQNYLNYANPKVDELYSKIKSELDKDKLKDLYHELYDELNEDLPAIFIYQRNDLVAYSTRVKGLIASPYQRYYDSLYLVSFEE